ncbi:MAG TPA: tetratricopeptide repeat protein [Cyclobacteriaceae bacterium]|nr:tetratricopeptide repeat protein [Cyclobacteriaceae bacterium]
MPLLNRSVPLKANFKWDMDGASQAQLNEGLNNLDEGNWSLALGNFESFLNTNYKLWVGHYYRGQTLMRLGRFKEARQEFIMVTRLDPLLVENYIELGEAMERLHEFARAEENYKKATEINPKFAYAYFKLGNLALLSKQPEEALKYYKKCNKIDPGFPDAYMAQGIIALLKDKKYDDAISFFGLSLRADSTFSQVYFWRGITYLQQNKKEECIADWNHFIRRNPRNLFIMTMRGFLKAELGNFDEAFADFRKVLQSTNVNEDKFQGAQTPLDKRIDLQFAANYLIKKGYGLKEEVFSNLKAGFCLLLMGQEKNAIQYLRKAERMATSPAVYFLMAIAFEHVGAHNFAYEYYDKSLRLDNDIFDAHKKRSIYLTELKLWDAAYKDIEEMLRIQPDAPIAYKLKGLMEGSQKKYPQAIDDLTRYIKSDTTDSEAFRTRALCYALSDQPHLATPDLSRVLSLNSKDENLYQNLVNDYLIIKDTVNSLFILKDYCSKYNSPQALLELAKILINQKKYEEAVNAINSAKDIIKKQQENLVIQNGRLVKIDFTKINSSLLELEGFIAFQQSLYSDAVKILNKSLSEDPSNLESRYIRGKSFAKLNNFKKAAEDMKELTNIDYKDSKELYQSFSKN